MKAICIPRNETKNENGQWFNYRITMPENPHVHDVEVTVEMNDGRIDRIRENLPRNVSPSGVMTKTRWSKVPENVTYRYINRKDSSDSR